MRRRVLLALSVILLVLIVVLGAVAWRMSRNKVDDSIVLSEPFHTVHGTTTENGSAFDEARVDLGTYRKVVVPDNASVWGVDRGEPLQLLMEKRLSYMGHPGEPMSIRAMRSQMGCATRREEEALLIATFGEWSSKEGGARMRVTVLVPDGVVVVKRRGLSGPESAGRGVELHGLAKGWTPVPDIPDPERKAE
jgi:hypothetical protein